MAEEALRLNAKEAIAFAFRHFDELFEGSALKSVLLEGVEFDDTKKQWLVTIGFDAGRYRTTEAQNALLFDRREPIRDIRTLYLDAVSGDLNKMK